MIDMGFYNERDFWLEDDETEYHVRAYYKHKWITGYFPAGHTYVHRNRFNTLYQYIHGDNSLFSYLLDKIRERTTWCAATLTSKVGYRILYNF